jgi:outer membrane lipoprotein SlyB
MYIASNGGWICSIPGFMWWGVGGDGGGGGMPWFMATDGEEADGMAGSRPQARMKQLDRGKIDQEKDQGREEAARGGREACGG